LLKHTKEITSLAFMPPAQFLYTVLLYTASADQSMPIGEVSQAAQALQLHVTSVDVAGDCLVADTQDGQVQLF
jgi:hypothetical protein